MTRSGTPRGDSGRHPRVGVVGSQRPAAVGDESQSPEPRKGRTGRQRDLLLGSVQTGRTRPAGASTEDRRVAGDGTGRLGPEPHSPLPSHRSCQHHAAWQLPPGSSGSRSSWQRRDSSICPWQPATRKSFSIRTSACLRISESTIASTGAWPWNRSPQRHMVRSPGVEDPGSSQGRNSPGRIARHRRGALSADQIRGTFRSFPARPRLHRRFRP